MPQFRKDPVTHRWVIVNVEQPRPPEAFSVDRQIRSSRVCPFCPGNESMTPPEIAAYGRKASAKNGAGWQVRVVPNKFPALRIEEPLTKQAMGVYDKRGGFGAHEVIIDTPDHEREFADLSIEQAEMLLRVLRDRCLDLRKDPRFQYALVFKNSGAAAGASLEHPHSQLIALPVVPSRVLGEVKGAQEHFERTDRCIYCDMIDQDQTERQLAVYEEADFLSIVPFASRFPFETWVLPRDHQSSFDAVSDDRLTSLARVLKITLGKIRAALNDPPYNFMVHTIPIHAREHDAFHWHIEIIPHLTRVAGFELGTGFYVNPTPAENAAEILRQQPAQP